MKQVKRSARLQGFTLVELMVVVAIIGLLAAVVTINVVGQTDTARRERVKADMDAIKSAIILFKTNTGRYPQQIEDLWQNPGQRGWSGPYLDEDKTPPRDPWQNEYVYEKNSGRDYMIISYGADGSPGGEEEDADLDSKSIHQSQDG